MTQRNNLYRRSSGIYVLRITVPARYRVQLGQREIHASTRTTDQSAAKAVACRLLDHWNSYLSELEMGQSGLPEAGKVSTSKAVISVGELSAVSGQHVEHVLRELLNYNIPVVYEVHSQPGFLVDDFRDVELDSELGGFVLNSAFEIGIPQAFSRFLKPFALRKTLLNVIETGFSEEVVFRLPQQKWQAAFFDLPGIRLTSRTILILKIHADKFFRLQKANAENPVSAPRLISERTPSASSSLPCECCRLDRAEQPVSLLMDTFLTKKQQKWKLDQQKKMATQCGTFVELMGNPFLGALNRQMIWDYEEKLRHMPANRYGAARRHGTQDANQLLALAEEHGEMRLSPVSVERYMDSLSSMFSWAVDNMILIHNPAKKAIEKQKRAVRDQDQRSQFLKEELQLIFSSKWFLKGTGERNKSGRFHQFRPYHYWLPLIGLYTGARLNEICQLYLTDIKNTDTGIYFFDFNDTSTKTDDNTPAPDKSLKNTSSTRAVPMHAHLVKLGLPEYITALKQNGYDRLFPELLHNNIKGYGKAAGGWFNEHFLGKALGIPRDGMRSFHSFRHTFITALDELDTPSKIQSQLAGHMRGETETANRYRKDRDSEKLKPYVDKLQYFLPPVAVFSVSDGLDAVRNALRRKLTSSKKS